MSVKPAVSVALLLAMTAALSSRAASQTAAPSSNTALVLGRVVDAATGQGVSSAVVRLMLGGKPVGAAALADADGRFVFEGLGAGAYTLTSERPGYFDSAFGQRRPTGAGLPLLLSDGARRGDVTIRMWPWSSITGTVIDEQGRRVPNVPVEAVRKLPDGSVASDDGVSAVTDSRVEYHLQPLAPGAYVVLARCRSINLPVAATTTLPAERVVSAPPAGSDDPTYVVDPVLHSILAVTGPVRDGDPGSRARQYAYVTSYYGGAPSLWQASSVAVGLGKTVTSIDIAVVLRPTIRVSGTISGPQGPAPGALVRVLSTDVDAADIDSATPDVAAAISGDSGTFTLPAVPEGNYLLDVTMTRANQGFAIDWTRIGLTVPAPRVVSRAGRDGAPTSAELDGYWGRTTLVAADRDISGLTLTLRTGTRIRSELIVQRPPSADTPAPFRLMLQHGDDPNAPAVTLRRDQSRSFEFPSVRPGWYVLVGQDLPPHLEIVSATLGGRDITGAPFEVGTGDIGTLVVTLGDRPLEIRGDVLDGRGRTVPDAAVVLFPQNASSWRNLTLARSSRTMQTQRTQTGGYSFTGLPSGDYFVAAVDDAMLDMWPSAELFRQISISATRVSVAPGDRRVVNLTMTPSK